jgi:predicted RecA/RadA family phage recombinase
MAKNQRYTNAKHIELTAPYDVLSGAPVRVGSICGIAQFDALSGARVTVWLDGSYDVQVTGAVATEGLPVYITAAGALNVTSTGNYRFGTALTTKAGAPIGTVEVAPIGYTDQTAVGA